MAAAGAAAGVADAGIAALIPDMNGHGESGGDRYRISIARWIEDIRRGIDYLGRRDDTRGLATAAFGVSTGGTAVIEAALVEPRINTMVLLAPTVRNMMTPAEQLAYYILLPLIAVLIFMAAKTTNPQIEKG